METPIAYKMKILYNDDTAIIDFLCDLEDRTPIQILHEGMETDRNIPGCILHNHKKEGIITLLLCNDPFEFNENNNILMLFVDANIMNLLHYYQRWFEAVEVSDIRKRSALYEIINLLKEQVIKDELKRSSNRME